MLMKIKVYENIEKFDKLFLRFCVPFFVEPSEMAQTWLNVYSWKMHWVGVHFTAEKKCAFFIISFVHLFIEFK